MTTIDWIKLTVLIVLGGYTAYKLIPEIVEAYRNFRWLEERKLEAWAHERVEFEEWRQSRTDLAGRMREER